MPGKRAASLGVLKSPSITPAEALLPRGPATQSRMSSGR